MNKNYQIKVEQRDMMGNKKTMLIEAQIISNEFDEHDTAGIMFTLEFASNNSRQMSIPFRVHISEKH